MNQCERLQLLFDELVSTSVAVDRVTNGETGTWTLECLEQQLRVSVSFSERDGLLTLQTVFPQPIRDKLDKTLEWMLTANQESRYQSGLRLALDRQGNPIQEMDIATADLELLQLRNTCEFFATRAAFHLMVLAEGGVDDEQVRELQPQMQLHPSMLV